MALPDGDGPGPWLETAAARPCREGIHACRPQDLAYWLHHELWEIELDGDIVEAGRKVVAAREAASSAASTRGVTAAAGSSAPGVRGGPATTLSRSWARPGARTGRND